MTSSKGRKRSFRADVIFKALSGGPKTAKQLEALLIQGLGPLGDPLREHRRLDQAVYLLRQQGVTVLLEDDRYSIRQEHQVTRRRKRVNVEGGVHIPDFRVEA